MTGTERQLLNGRYRVVAPISRGAQGTTSRAIDEPTGSPVALKELDFARVGSWDAVEIFEREAAVLGGLSHDRIPRVLETFQVEGDVGLRLFIVQEFVPGEDLQVRLDSGALFDEPTLRRIADSVLELLVYLHQYSPPVVHRDIKPANLIERPSGEIVLVDFGAAQGDSAGEVVIGTTGYMPAEQLMGRAMPSSDLYALGATLIHLATRKHPSELGHGLELRWRDKVNLSERFSDWIDRLVAPMPEDRFLTAVSAQRALDKPHAGQTHDETLEDASLFGLVDSIEVQNMARFGPALSRYDIRLQGNLLFVTWRNRPWSWLPRLVQIAFFTSVLVTMRAEIALPLCFIWGLYLAHHTSGGVLQLTGHPFGLDVVWARTELVERIKIEDIAAPDLTQGVISKLTVWQRNGSPVHLDHSTLQAKELEVLRSAIQQWLANVRELE